jgi:hypothetical protein
MVHGENMPVTVLRSDSGHTHQSQFAKLPRLALPILVFLSLSPFTVTGTTIVIKMTSTQIVIAADSLASFINPKQISYRPACKLLSAGKYCFAASGLIKSRDGAFDAYAIALPESKSAVSLRSSPRSSLKRLRSPSLIEWPHSRRKILQNFAKF